MTSFEFIVYVHLHHSCLKHFIVNNLIRFSFFPSIQNGWGEKESQILACLLIWVMACAVFPITDVRKGQQLL